MSMTGSLVMAAQSESHSPTSKGSSHRQPNEEDIFMSSGRFQYESKDNF